MSQDITRLLKSLDQMAEKVKTATQQLDRAEGRLESLMGSLKKDFDCDTTEAAIDALNELDRQISAKETELISGIEKLEASYEWN